MARNDNIGAIIIIAVIVIAIGSSNTNLTIEDKFHSSCLDITDNNNNGQVDLFADSNCQNYPYDDGNGENGTNSLTYPAGENAYDVFDDLFEYANYSYVEISTYTGYPGTLEDYYCDIINQGGASYIQLYDNSFGTNIQLTVDNWYIVNCVNAGNGLANQGGNGGR